MLKSIKDKSYYYGSSKDLEQRLREHNRGRSRYTKGHIPFEIHYFESFSTRKEAILRENFFKSIDGYNWLKSKGII
ncbi:MAG: GIY-YIG nuclease family protein [Ignavibacteriaceae bacterium]